MARRCKLCRRKTAGLVINLHAFCSIDHAIEWARDEKNQRQAVRENTRRQRADYYANDKGHWEKKARMACHRYIRLRDSGLPCISCGRHHAGQYHASHYRPSGVNSELRYNELNIHKACSVCNTHKSGNLTEYRKRLIEKIGIDNVEMLDNNHELKRWTLEELKGVHRYYTEKVKELKCQNTL